MSVDFAEQRVKMVDGQLRVTDVTDRAVLAAMLTVPREAFVPEKLRALAYIDADLDVGEGRFIMEPSPFGRLVQLAEITPADRVLDVGSATGYSAAILSRIAGHVVALESASDLGARARENFSRLGFDNVEIAAGDLVAGHAAGAPYDVIVIEGAVDEVPEALFAQLAEGGRLVAVVGRGPAARATLYRKDQGIVSHRSAFNAGTRPLAGFSREAAFQL